MPADVLERDIFMQFTHFFMNFPLQLIKFCNKNLRKNYNFNPFYTKYLHEMNNVYFRHTPDNGELIISFRYTNSTLNINQEFNFCRNTEENVELCLGRIKNKIENEIKKKKSKKKRTANEETKPVSLPEGTIQWLKCGENITNVTFSELLKDPEMSENVVLRVFNENFKILLNTPWVISLTLPTLILAGFPLYPKKMDIQFGTKEHSKGVWFRGAPPSKNSQQIKWEKCGEGFLYETSINDVGNFIKFELTPGNSEIVGLPLEAISNEKIVPGPGRCPFEDRHLFTKNRLSGDKFRVMSYNILAELYSDTDIARKELFKYCSPAALKINYRKQLFIKEISGYNSDIICLQEVDVKIFEHDLLLTLGTSHNYDGQLQQKTKSAEGVATFYNRDRFEFVRSFGLNIGENIPKLDIFKELWMKIMNNEKLAKRIVDRTTAVQATVLKSKDTDNVLIVANTHLYYHPDADHIRLLQIGFAMLYLDYVYKNTIEDLNVDKSKLSIIFCGDFNSVPECGIYKLLTSKFVGEDFIDWSSNKEEAVKGVTLSQPFNIQSACGCPKYTNFTVGFADCLDYIFYQTDNIQVEAVIPLPSEEQLKEKDAIPSELFPSDHVALVADFKFTQG